MKLVKLPPDAEQTVEDSGEEEDEGKEVAEELEVAVKHVQLRITSYEVRSGKDGLRVIRLRVGEVPRFLRRDRRKGEEKREL